MGKGKEPQNRSSALIAGSEKSISFSMMLSKVSKVAIECVQATPLRWPLASHQSETFFRPKRDCLKNAKMSEQCLRLLKKLAHGHSRCKGSSVNSICTILLLFSLVQQTFVSSKRIMIVQIMSWSANAEKSAFVMVPMWPADSQL